MFNLKKIGWYLDENNKLFVYKGNQFLEEEIVTEDNGKVYKFIKAFNNPMEKRDLQSKCSFLTSKEFEDIFNYFCNKAWIYKLNSPVRKSELRLSRFVDSIPEVTYPLYKEKIKNLKFLILGAGTGGSYLLEVLIKLGFNNFTIIDDDKVEEKNIGAQNYLNSQIGKYKVDILAERYGMIANVKSIKQHINSYDQLDDLIDLTEYQYFINCADDFILQISLMKKLFNEYPKMKMTYGGYSFLLHSDTLITKDNYKVLMKRANEERDSMILENYISENSSSIFNGFLSAFAISKIIFNDVLGKRNERFIGNFLLDSYKFE